MKSVKENLQNETEKWLRRLKEEQIEAAGDGGDMFLENIKAYTKDADYFRKEGDLVRAFEAVVWAWSWLEIGEELGILDRS